MLSQYTYVSGILDGIKTPHMKQIQSQLDYYINHGKNTPKTGSVGLLEKKKTYWWTLSHSVMIKPTVALAV